MSLKDTILAAQDHKLEPVPVPEWGCTVYVPLLMLEDAEQLQKIKNDHPKLAAFIIRDEQGNRVFSDDEAVALNQKSLNAFNRILNAYNKLNGHGEDAGKN